MILIIINLLFLKLGLVKEKKRREGRQTKIVRGTVGVIFEK